MVHGPPQLKSLVHFFVALCYHGGEGHLAWIESALIQDVGDVVCLGRPDSMPASTVVGQHSDNVLTNM